LGEPKTTMIKMGSLDISDKEYAWKRKLSVGKLQKISKEHGKIIQYM